MLTPRRSPVSLFARPASVVSIVAIIAMATPAAAQDGGDLSTGTSAAPVTTPTLPDPAAAPTATEAIPADPTATTTTEPFTESLEGGNSAYGGQKPFDLSSMAVLTDRLAEEQARLGDLVEERERLASERSSIDATLAALDVQMAALASQSSASIEAAANARREALGAAVEAYVNGDAQAQLAGTIGDPITFSRARTYLGALSTKRQEVSRAYRELSRTLDGEQQTLATDIADAEESRDRVDAAAMMIETHILYATQNVDALERGSHVIVDGLVFPVAGPVHFVDSWGFARLPGTAQAHWHEGIDIMAPNGRELVATEGGVIEKVGTAGLGGRRLWLIGDSGVEYYYAHLSGYAPDIADGVRVEPGQLVGYVGDTGGASGGPPHLHMQIHPDGGDPVNPYPALVAALGDAPTLTQAEALAGPPVVLAESLSEVVAPPRRPLAPWLVSPTPEAPSRLVTWTSAPH